MVMGLSEGLGKGREGDACLLSLVLCLWSFPFPPPPPQRYLELSSRWANSTSFMMLCMRVNSLLASWSISCFRFSVVWLYRIEKGGEVKGVLPFLKVMAMMFKMRRKCSCLVREY